MALQMEDAGHITLTIWTRHCAPAIVTLGGDLDMVSAPVVREQLLSLLRPGASQLIIDLSATRYADASGLAVLVGSQRRAVLLGGAVRLAAPQPEVARALAVSGIVRHLDVYPTVQDAITGREQAMGEAGLAVTAASALPAQARPESAADSRELRAAVTELLANADAWRDADPRRRFAPALRALAQAHAGTSYAALTQAARSLLSVLSREPLTYSPAVAATARRLRGLLSAAPSASAIQCGTG
jgi:anti-anti-sigma factor